MILRPGDLLGLPPGFPDVVLDVAKLRYVLLLLLLAWGALVARARPALALLGGIAFAEAAVGFWVLALGRPYGLLVEPEATRRAARVSVTCATGDASETFLAGEPAGPDAWTTLARAGVPEGALLLAPTLLPLLILPALAGLIHALWAPRGSAPLGAALWLAFSTGDLETLRGAGFLPGLWSHPEASVALLVLVALALGLGRLARGGAGAILLGLGLAGLVVSFVRGAGLASPAETLLLLTLDQGPWLVLALLGLRRGLDAASKALVLGGALLLASGALGAPVDAWGAHALYRLGLILAAVGPVAELAGKAGEALGRIGVLSRLDRLRLGTAAILVLLAPGSFLAWWDPTRLDPAAKGSLEALSRPLLEAMGWIRGQTPPSAVFLASPDYAPAVAALAGRRVLRAPTLAAAGDDERRMRAERVVLSGREPGPLAERYGLTHVFIAPGDFASHGLRAPEDLETLGRFRLRYADAEGMRVYEIRVE